MKNEEIKMLKKLGQNIKSLREEKKITLKEVSEKTGIRRHYLAKIEQGNAKRVKISYIFLIAEALDIKPHVLVEKL